MKFLIIGLGSMGKRRIRNLMALRYTEDSIAGFDIREDRRLEAKTRYRITTYEHFEKALEEFKPNIFIISTPPDLHMYYAFIAEQMNIHCFIEASVVDADKILELSKKVKGKKILMAPSCTMKFTPMVMKIRELLNDNVIGKVINYNYHVGQYLPDWHPWERIEDFYVSKRETGGCREIVPFELTWLKDVFGKPMPLTCIKGKLSDINADIDDIYHFTIKHEDGVIGNVTIEVISRPKATREIRILGSEGILIYSQESNQLKYINISMKDWRVISFDRETIEEGYINPEEPYISELASFLKSVHEVENGLNPSFPNTLEEDAEILYILYSLEKLSKGINELPR